MMHQKDNQLDPPIVAIESIYDASVHQCGVNSMDISKRGEIYHLLSGGDDQMIHLMEFCFDCTSESLKIIPLRSCSINIAQNSAISSIRLMDDFLFASGPDQRLHVWSLRSTNGLKLEMVASCSTQVQNVDDLDVTR
jgi:WD40 repeat protein